MSWRKYKYRYYTNQLRLCCWGIWRDCCGPDFQKPDRTSDVEFRNPPVFQRPSLLNTQQMGSSSNSSDSQEKRNQVRHKISLTGSSGETCENPVQRKTCSLRKVAKCDLDIYFCLCCRSHTDVASHFPQSPWKRKKNCWQSCPQSLTCRGNGSTAATSSTS